MIRSLTALILMICPVAAMSGDGHHSLIGFYHCNELCRAFDTQASIDHADGQASCRDETGKKSAAKILSDRVIFCLGRIGHLSTDGETLRWDHGGVWRRSHITRF